MSNQPGFLRRGPISPQLHGTLDYPLAAISQPPASRAPDNRDSTMSRSPWNFATAIL
jgi:hypothetical protein